MDTNNYLILMLFIGKFIIILRDLKPANLFLKGNTIKIGDFGFCRYNCTINEKFTFGVGTTKYMAP